MMTRLFLFLACFSIAFSAHAELYKWVGPDGKINYSDTPPPKSAANVQTQSRSGSDYAGVLPYQLAQAVKNMPVILYGAEKCMPCDQARNFLKSNGIPFSERTISTNEDAEKLKRLVGDTQIPAVKIGNTNLTGFNDSQWRTNLTQAGYPTSNLLPADYQFAPAQPLVPVATPGKPTNGQTKSAPNSTELPPRDPNGFRF